MIAPYLSLFSLSFLAATILPAQSEIMLGAMARSGDYHLLWLFIAASAGNIAGACVNRLLGLQIHRFEGKKWFPVSKKSLERAARFYRKYGLWTLLLSWVPFIGDPLTIVAGVMRVPFRLFLIPVAIGKAGRYLFVIYAVT